MRTSARSLAFVILTLALAELAGAAPRQPTSPARFDLYGGYSYTSAGDAGLHGVGLDASHPWKSFRVVLDLTGHYGSFAGADFSQYALLLGLRRSWPFRPVSPFAEVLVGAARLGKSIEVADGTESDSTTSWGGAIGGGVERKLHDRWSARLVLHLRLLHAAGAWDADPRLSVGAVYRFGR